MGTRGQKKWRTHDSADNINLNPLRSFNGTYNPKVRSTISLNLGVELGFSSRNFLISSGEASLDFEE